MRFLLLGLGSIGSRHCRILREMGHTVVTVDPNPAKYADYQGFSKLEDIPVDEGVLQWSRSEFDGVMDCTPPDVRDGWNTKATHRFVEKPLGHIRVTATGEWTRSILVDPIMLGFCYRWNQRLANFVCLINRHQIYHLSLVGGVALQSWHKEDYRTRKYWGVVLDSLPHSFYIARWMLGELELVGSVIGKQSDLEIDTEDSAAALLKSADGVLCYCYADYLRQPGQFRIEAVTSGGVYHWEFNSTEADEMYWRQMQAWVNVCRGDLAAGYPNLEDGLAVQGLLDGVLR